MRYKLPFFLGEKVNREYCWVLLNLELDRQGGEKSQLTLIYIWSVFEQASKGNVELLYIELGSFIFRIPGFEEEICLN